MRGGFQLVDKDGYSGDLEMYIYGVLRFTRARKIAPSMFEGGGFQTFLANYYLAFASLGKAVIKNHTLFLMTIGVKESNYKRVTSFPNKPVKRFYAS